MKRVFTALATADLLVLLATAALGLRIGDHLAYKQHFALALFAAVLTMAVHVLVFTYFSGTGRLMLQAVFIGKLDPAPIEQIKRYKQRVARCVAAGAFAIIATGAFGALIESAYEWHLWHGLVAGLTVLVNAVAFYIERACIDGNAQVMNKVIDAYNDVRAKSSELKQSPFAGTRT